MEQRLAVYVESSIYCRGETISYLQKKGFRVIELKKLSELGIGWLTRNKVALVVMKPYRAMGQRMAIKQGKDDLWAKAIVEALRADNSANRTTPILAYSRCRVPDFVLEKFRQYNITPIPNDAESFKKTIDDLFS